MALLSSLNFVWIILFVLLGLISFIYLGLPLFVKFEQKVPGKLHLERIDPVMWPPAVAEVMRQHERDLYVLGFEISERFALPNPMPRIVSMATMLIHRGQGDKAMIVAGWNELEGEWTLGILYLEFSTRFADGRHFLTMNSSELGAFVRPSETVKTQVPQIKDAAKLYRLHRYVMEKHGAPVGKLIYPPSEKLVYPPGGARVYFEREWREALAYQAQWGRFDYNAATDIFVPSFVGAYLLGWQLLWPMSWIRRKQMMKRARTIIDEFEAHVPASNANMVNSRGR